MPSLDELDGNTKIVVGAAEVEGGIARRADVAKAAVVRRTVVRNWAGMIRQPVVSDGLMALVWQETMAFPVQHHSPAYVVGIGHGRQPRNCASHTGRNSWSALHPWMHLRQDEPLYTQPSLHAATHSGPTTPFSRRGEEHEAQTLSAVALQADAV